MTAISNADSIEAALLEATEERKEAAIQPFLGYYFVSEDDMRKLEEGVDLRQMNRLLEFLSAGLKKRTAPVRRKLELVFDFDDESQPAAVEKTIARDAFGPLELDWDEFYGHEKPRSDIRDITHAVREEADEAITPTANLDVTGEAMTPNIHMEVADKFTLKQRLLYKDLPEETYLLLSMGTDLEALLQAAERFRDQRGGMTHEQFVSLCANIYRGYGVRFYYQLVHQQQAIGDAMDESVKKHMVKVDRLITEGTFSRSDLEAQLATLFLVNENMRQNADGSEILYNSFVKSDAFEDVA